MIAEINAAVGHIKQHLCSGASADVAHRLASSLSTALPERCSASWDVDEPEKGSAARALHWQRHPGGEGLDSILLDACRDAGARDDEEAVTWLPAPFTLWIDPGCVAVRLGPGPGAARSGFNFADGISASTASFRHGSINVVFGHLPIEAPSMPSLPTVALLPSTPNLSDIKASMAQRQQMHSLHGLPRGPSGLAIGSTSYHHQRTASDASSSSFCSSTFSAITRGGSEVSRCTSMSSSSSIMGDVLVGRRGAGSDCCAGEDEDAEDDQDERASLDGLADDASQITLDDVRRAGFFGTLDLIDDDDDKDGDATVAAADISVATVRRQQQPACSTPARAKRSDETDHSSTPVARPSFVPTHKKQSASGSELNFTVHDRGNVGVLGGGVKLGGASPARKERTNLRTASGSSSVTTSPTRVPRAQAPAWVPSGEAANAYPALPPPPSLQQHPHQHQHQHHAEPTVWSDAALLQPQHSRHFSQTQHYLSGAAPSFYPQQQQGAPTFASQRGHGVNKAGLGFEAGYTFPPSSDVKGLFGTSGGAGDVFGFVPEHAYGMPYGGNAAHHAFLSVDPATGLTYSGAPGLHLGMTVPVPLPGQGKRVRSRGRRSRGRGAGRAARRHAAALRALAEKQGKTLDEFLAEQEANDEKLRAATAAVKPKQQHDEYDDDDDDEGSDVEDHHDAHDSRRASIASSSSASSSSDDASPHSPPTPCDPIASSKVPSTSSSSAPRSDEDIMRLVRQRADEVARSLERRRAADLELRRNQSMASQYGMAGAAWVNLRPGATSTATIAGVAGRQQL